MSDNHTQRIVNKAWSFAHLLRDDGLSYMEYTEQITFLLFLKMAHERTQPPWSQPSMVPDGLDWPSLLAEDGADLESHYRHILTELSRKDGMLGEIFRRARQRIQNPATLKRLIVDLIDPEDWSSLAADVKGDIYEGLLAKSAQESPKGAGQYFTPREVIRAIVDVMRPGPDDTVCDPACGTGGFLLAAHDHVLREHGSTLDPDQKRHLRGSFVQGMDIVPATARLCIMNLYLHGIDADPCPVRSGVDSLASDPGGQRFSMVLTNPPFGKKSTIRIVNDTLLRLPTGIFYAQGVKANVLFFDAKPASEKPWTERLWVYDLRTNKHFTLKMKPLRRSDLDEFVECYRPGERHTRQPTWGEDNPDGRWRAYDYEELVERDKLNLDLSWLRDRSLEDSENLPEPEVIAAQIAEDLRSAPEAFEEIAEELGRDPEGIAPQR